MTATETNRKAVDLQPGDIFIEGQGTETVTRVEKIGPYAVIIHIEGREYGTFSNNARFVLTNEPISAPPVEESVSRAHALTARPKAGAPAANQYGVFKVSYATQKQTNFIKALMDRKDLSGFEGDVELLREQVAATQVNKKAASDIIDRLLALPDAAVAPAATGRPATDKQKQFVRTLLEERAGNETAEAVRDALNEARVSGNLTATVVSHAISSLLEIPKNVSKPAVPDGRYALPAEDGHFVFYRVTSPQEGRWAGYTFVVQLIGSVGSWDEKRVSRDVSRSVLDRIAADSEEAARMFGLKARACGMCGSPLSNIQSRAAGYGETCAGNNGFFYPNEEEARNILAERGEETS